MRKHKKALLCSLTGLLIVSAVVILFIPRRHLDHQPVYKGLTLAQWLDVVARHRVNGYFATYQKGRPPSQNATPQQIHEAEEAVRAIGTNALPHLLAWINPKPNAIKRFYRGILNLLPVPDHTRGFLWGLPGTKDDTLAQFAVEGFRLLNTNALPALGTLSKLADDKQILAAKALFAVTNTAAQ